ncbi:MAG: hypothetical protein NVSMB23_18670 [Myxococcales bacterium]
MSPSLQRLPGDPSTLADLLRTGLLRRVPAGAPDRPEGPRPLSIGVPALDLALGGGLWRGQLHEIVAPPSAGGTALLRAALAAATLAGELCALIDPADAFVPRGARAAGLDLRRLLWVRPETLAQALRAAEIALESRFSLVAIDLAGFPPAPAPPPRGLHVVRVAPSRKAGRAGPSPWARLSRRAEKHGGALLVLARTAQAGAFAAATVELSRSPPRWEGSPDTPGRLLSAGAALGAVARSRRAPPSSPLLLHLPLHDGEDGPAGKDAE